MTNAQTDSLEARLEALIDGASLATVIDALASVCYSKAEHLSTNWQDDASARVWERHGSALQTRAARARKDRV